MTAQDTVVDVSHDWEQACLVQASLMQGMLRNPGSVQYGASCRQMRALGGDCYDFSRLAGGQFAFLLGDASGKGVAAALIMASVRASLRTAALFRADDLSALLAIVNVQACAVSLAENYVTLFYAVLEPGTRWLRYVNAGHNPPAVFHEDGAIEWLVSSGAPVGLFSDLSWREQFIQLRPGGRILACTDGVTDALNSKGESWGIDGLLRAVQINRHESVDDLVRSIFAAMDEYTQSVQTDDAARAVLKIS